MRQRRWISIWLLVCLLASLLPTTAFAGENVKMQANQSELTVEKSVIAFGGHEWYVIGYDGNGVYSNKGEKKATLLAKSQDWGNIPFRKGTYSAFEGSQYNTSDNYYYATNPSDMKEWESPNEYAGSTLQQRMEEIAEEFPKLEKGLIEARTFNVDQDDIGQNLSQQKVWALSESEANLISQSIRSYNGAWWLRSPNAEFNIAADLISFYGYVSRTNIFNANVVRPAFRINLDAVLFTSAAEGGKASATVGSGLVDTEVPTSSDTMKFTMKTAKQQLKVNATTAESTQTGETLSFGYSGATTGTNQFVSCILTDKTDKTEAIKYYGKLANSSEAASGTLSIPLSGVADGEYILQLFSEQANDGLYTDFASEEPITMDLSVKGEIGTVSNFKGTVHDHSWSREWDSDKNGHWHPCTAANCPITDNSKKAGYAAHAYNQEVHTKPYEATAADCTHPATYYVSCICGKPGTETFSEGDAKGHDWGEPKWTWSKDGTTAEASVTCKRDDSHRASPQVTMSSKNLVAPTCMETGQAQYRASITLNGKTYEAVNTVTTPVIPHTFVWKTDKAATATEKGSKHEECTVCGYEKAAVEIPALKPEEETVTLKAPTNVKVAPAYDRIKLSWNKVKGATGYQVYRAAKRNGKYKKVKTTTKASWTNKKLKTGKTYYYKIRAYRKQKGKTIYSGYSAKKKAVVRPEAPVLRVKASKGKITAKWSKVRGATKYQLYRASKKKGKYYKWRQTVKTRYTDWKVKKGKTYYYKARAYRVVKGKKIYSTFSPVKTIRAK